MASEANDTGAQAATLAVTVVRTMGGGAEDLADPVVAGRYEIRGVLGAGGMGTVDAPATASSTKSSR